MIVTMLDHHCVIMICILMATGHDNFIGSIFSFAVFAMTLVLVVWAQWAGKKRERERRHHMLNFAPSGRTSNSLSRRDSQDSYLNRLRDNIKLIV